MRAKLARLKKTLIALIAAVLIIPLGIMFGLALPGKYVTLTVIGDSYSAGNGAGQYYYNYESARNWGHNYQKWLNEQGYHTVMHDLAISGAETQEGIWKDIQKQAQKVPTDTDLLMMTAGGNDVKFSRIIAFCYTIFATSNGCRNQINYAYQTLPAAMAGVEKTFQLAQKRLKPGAKIVYVGYPLLAEDDNYTLNTWFQEKYWASKNIRQFGRVAEQMQREMVDRWNANPDNKNKITFVPLVQAFAGHEPNPGGSNPYRWVNEFGEDNSYQPSAGQEVVWHSSADLMVAYHPNVTGHEKIAEQVQTLMTIDKVPYRQDDATAGRNTDVTFLVDISKNAQATLDTAKRQVPKLAQEIKDSTPGDKTARYSLYRFTQPYWWDKLQDYTTDDTAVINRLNGLQLDRGGSTEGYAAPRTIEDIMYWAPYRGDNREDSAYYADRKVIYVYTDGKVKNYSDSNWLDRIMQSYKRDAVEIWVIAPDVNQVDPKFKELALRTGGTVLSFDDVDKAFATPPTARVRITNTPAETVFAPSETVNFDASESKPTAANTSITWYEWQVDGELPVHTEVLPTFGSTFGVGKHTLSLVAIDSNNNRSQPATVSFEVTRDGDTIADDTDNCPDTRNQDQRDSNNNGRGDACDPVVPNLTVDPNFVKAGEQATAHLVGFGPSENLEVGWTQTPNVSNYIPVTTGETGEVTVPIDTTSLRTGYYSFYIKRADSPIVRFAQRLYVQKDGETGLRASASPAAIGEEVTLYASGMPANQNVQFSADGTVIGTANADKNGNAELSYTIPASTSQNSISLKAESSGAKTATLILLVYRRPTVTAPPAVLSGHTFTVSAEGIKPSEIATFTGDGVNAGITKASDQNGHAEADLTAKTVTDDFDSTVSVTANGLTGTAQVRILALANNASVQVSPNPILAGEEFTASAFGFRKGDEVTFTVLKGSEPVATQTATVEAGVVDSPENVEGVARTTFTLSATQLPAGDYTVKVSNARGTAEAPLKVLSNLTLSATSDPEKAFPGDIVNVTADGFLVGDVLSFYGPNDSEKPVCTVGATGIGAESTGSASCQFTIPATADPGTSYEVTVKGRSGIATVGIPIKKRVSLTVTADPSSALIGSSVSLKATGQGPTDPVGFQIAQWTGKDEPTAEELNSMPWVAVTANPVISENGTATLTWTAGDNAPNQRLLAGKYYIRAISENGSGVTPFTLQQDLNSTLTATPSNALAGNLVELKADGFKDDEDVTFTITGPGLDQPVTLAAKAAGTSGSNNSAVATQQWSIPEGLRGDYSVVAESDRGVSNTATVSVMPKATVVVSTNTSTYDPTDKVEITVGGFEDGEVFTLTTPDGKSSYVTQNGSTAQATWEVPATWTKQNPVTITAKNERGEGSAQITINPSITPTVTLNSTSVVAGNSVTATATGFSQGESVTLTPSTGEQVVKQADSNGSVTATFTVSSDSPAGTFTVTAASKRGSGTASATVRPVLKTTLVADPTTVVAGNTVTFTASGFEASEDATLTIDGQEYKVQATNGTVTYQWAVPEDHASKTVKAKISSDRGSSQEIDVTVLDLHKNAKVELTDGKSKYFIDDEVHGTVSGFSYGEEITLTTPDGSTQILTANSSRGATFTWTVPKNQTTTQSAEFKATSARGNATTSTALFGTMTPTLTLDPNPVIAGNSVTVTAGGYEPGESVTIEGLEQKLQDTASNEGTVTAIWTVPANHVAGTENITTYSTRGKKSETLTVRAVLDATVSTNPTTVVAGSVVTLTATGLEPKEENVYFLIDGTKVGPATVNDKGVGTYSWTVPAENQEQTSTVTVTSDRGTSGNAQLKIVPKNAKITVTLDKSEYNLGDTVTMTISGFAQGSDFSVNFPDGTTQNYTATEGSTKVTWTVPQTMSEIEQASFGVIGKGQSGNGAAEARINGHFTPSVTAEPSPIIAGNTVTVTASGYRPNETVTFTTPDKAEHSETANSSGVATFKWQVPTSETAGSKTVTITNPRSEATATVTVRAILSSTVTATPTPVIAGQELTLSADGFEPSENVTFTIDGTEIPATAKPDGTSTVTWPVPKDHDTATVTATVKTDRGTSTSGDIVIKSLLANSDVTLTTDKQQYVAGVDPAIALSITGFDADDQVTISGLGKDHAQAFGDAKTLTVSLTLSESTTPGPLTLTVSSLRGTFTHEVQILGTLKTKVTATPAQAQPGQDVVFDVSGLKPSEELTFTLPDGAQKPATATTDGKASVTWTVPASQKAGDATVTAANSRVTATGSVTITARPAPTLKISRSLFAVDYDTKATITVDNLIGNESGKIVFQAYQLAARSLTQNRVITEVPFTATDGKATISDWAATSQDFGDYTGRVLVTAVVGDGADAVESAVTDITVINPKLTFDKDPVKPGDTVTIQVSGMAPGVNYTMKACPKDADNDQACTPLTGSDPQWTWKVPEDATTGDEYRIALVPDDLNGEHWSAYWGVILGQNVVVTTQPVAPTTTPKATIAVVSTPTASATSSVAAEPTTTTAAPTTTSQTTTTSVQATATPSQAVQPSFILVPPSDPDGGAQVTLSVGPLPTDALPLPAPATQQPDPLATTGAQLRDKLIYATVLVLAGLVLVFAMRRRRRDDAGERKA